MRSTVLLIAFSTTSVLACGGDDTTGPQTGNGTPTVASVVVPSSTATLESLGETVQLIASAKDASGNTISNKTFTWSSSNESIAAVSSSGLVTAVANGSVTITATADGVSGTASIVVAQEVATVEVTPAADTVFVGGSVQLTAAALDGNGNNVAGKTFSWSSSDGTVASVDGSGLVTGVAAGIATITAEVDGQTGNAAVTALVLQAPTLEDALVTTSLVALTWSSSTNGASFARFELYRDTQAGVSWQNTLVATLSNPTDTSFIDNSVVSGQEYYYRVFELANDGATVGSNEISVTLGSAIGLNAVGFDLAVDAARGLVYVSLPILNEVAVISASTNLVVDRVVVGSRPHGIDISDDGSTLYVALNGAGSIVAVDLDTHELSEIVVGDSLGHATAYDVVAGAPNRVFVSANPGSSGFAWIVMISTDQGNAYKRVASNRIIRASPVFEKSPDRTALYVGEGFSPNSLYRLDLNDPDAPIVLEDEHGSVSGTSRLSISPDGTRIYLRSGQVVRTGSFIQAGLVGSGVPKVSLDGGQVFVGTCSRPVLPGSCTLEIYDTSTLLLVEALAIDGPDPGRIAPFPDGTGVWVLAADLLYSIALQ